MNNLTSAAAVVVFFCVLFLLIKKAAYTIYHEDDKHFSAIKHWYYWFEYIYLATVAVLTPCHSISEGMATMIVVVLFKIMFDRFTFIDDWFCHIFKKEDCEDKL